MACENQNMPPTTEEKYLSTVPSITIGNETFYSDRFYLNAPTGLSYYDPDIIQKENASRCKCQHAPPLFDRNKLINSLDLKAAIIGTYTLSRSYMLNDLKKLFAKGPDGTSEVPVLVLHGKGFNREEATEGGLETIGHFPNEKAQKEDEELRKLYQIFMKEQENKRENKREIEIIDLLSDSDNDDTEENSPSKKIKMYDKSLDSVKEEKKEDFTNERRDTTTSQSDENMKHAGTSSKSSNNFPKRIKKEALSNERKEEETDPFGTNVYFSMVDTFYLPQGYTYNEKDIEKKIVAECKNVGDSSDPFVIDDSDDETVSEECIDSSTNALEGLKSEIIKQRKWMAGVQHPKYMILFEKSGSVVVVVSSSNLTRQKPVDGSWIQRFEAAPNANSKENTPIEDIRERCDGSDFGYILSDFLQKQSEAVQENDILPIQFLRRYIGGRFDSIQDFRRKWKFEESCVHLVSTVPGYFPGTKSTKHLARVANGGLRILYGPQRVSDILTRLIRNCHEGAWLPQTIFSTKDRLILQQTSIGAKWTSEDTKDLVQQYMVPTRDLNLLENVDILWPSMTYMDKISQEHRKYDPRDSGHFVFLHSSALNKTDDDICTQMKQYEDVEVSGPIPYHLTPHIKTYSRLLHRDDYQEDSLAWSMLTSACFSRGAQGKTVKKNTSFHSEDEQSYSNFELGILFVSRIQNQSSNNRLYTSFPRECICKKSKKPHPLQHTSSPNIIPLPFPFKMRSSAYQMDSSEPTFCQTPFFHEMTEDSLTNGNCAYTPFGSWCRDRLFNK